MEQPPNLEEKMSFKDFEHPWIMEQVYFIFDRMLAEWEVDGELEYTEEGYPDYKTNQKSHRQQAIAEALDVYNALANWKTPISRKYFISNFIVRCRKIQKLHQRACQENNLEFPFPDTHITNAEIDAYQ